MATPVYDRSGYYRGFLIDDNIYDRSGTYLGFVDGGSVWAKNGRYVGELHDQMVLDKHRARANRAGRASSYPDAFDCLERR